eukprot:CAMPEP_0179083832 /NCGR_PEP_ID=MMETSP0796-20121207/37878_1 /TAXON_ID=73915 /ORGANISM="Pyrodinium bahamense, Strain pbaha01" /LENGTH=181 /DNA_ID=CAMNT_0020781245 /DNA_START=156 /DNA_END=701 /DNA_ORIENTATION=-
MATVPFYREAFQDDYDDKENVDTRVLLHREVPPKAIKPQPERKCSFVLSAKALSAALKVRAGADRVSGEDRDRQAKEDWERNLRAAVEQQEMCTAAEELRLAEEERQRALERQEALEFIQSLSKGSPKGGALEKQTENQWHGQEEDQEASGEQEPRSCSRTGEGSEMAPSEDGQASERRSQ